MFFVTFERVFDHEIRYQYLLDGSVHFLQNRKILAVSMPNEQ